MKRVIALFAVLAAALGLMTGIGWMGCHLVRSQFGG